MGGLVERGAVAYEMSCAKKEAVVDITGGICPG
jgi:hypothetical protein